MYSNKRELNINGVDEIQNGKDEVKFKRGVKLREDTHLLDVKMGENKARVLCSIQKNHKHLIYKTKLVSRDRQPEFHLDPVANSKLIFMRRARDEKLAGVLMEDGRFRICDSNVEKAYEMSKLGLDISSLSDIIRKRGPENQAITGSS